MPAHRGRNFLVRKGKDLEERFIGNAYMFTPEERKALLKIRTNAPDPMAITKPFYDKVQDQDDVTKMQYLDLHMWMAGDILLKADKMSMANSLELRVPFLDKKVMELAEQIPTRYRVTREAVTDEKTPYITKYAMRLAAKKDTPPQTAKTAAKKKLGFPVPIRVWLKEDKYYSIVRNALRATRQTGFSTPKSWCICWTITVQARQTTAGRSGHCICSWYGTRSIFRRHAERKGAAEQKWQVM